MKRSYWFIPLLIVLLGIGLPSTIAQDGGTVLSISVPENMAEVLNNGLLDQFRQENPDINIHVIETGGGFFIGVGFTEEIESYLNGIEEEITQADVLYVDASDITPESTRAGYFLDLSPLVSVDNALDTGDFYAPIWRSYQWDGGTWAVPVSANTSVLLYDPVAFDNAGLEYPQDWWTIYDLESAMRTLAEYDESGAVVTPSMFDLGNNMTAVILGTLGQGVVNDSVFPSVPDFSNPQLEDLMTIWQGMQQDGLFQTGGGRLDFDAVPMVMGPSQIAGANRLAGNKEFVLLPGGASFDASGFAISAGTKFPEAAYRLVSFLSRSPEISSASFGNIPARRSLTGASANNGPGGPGGGGPGGGFSLLSPEMLEIVQPALENGLSAADLRFAESIPAAVDLMTSDGLDARTALQEVELDVLNRLDVASSRAGSTVLQVAPPPGEVVLAPGEISLSFGIGSSFRQFGADNKEWEQVAADFVAADPEVGEIVLDTENGFGSQLGQMTETYDCFYLPSNAVQGADLSQLLSLDPLLASDPSFDPNNMVGNTMAQVQRNNQTWALPITVQPEVMMYNLDEFQQAGAFEPYPGWTVTDFENALRTIKIDPEDPEPMVPQNIGGTYMMVLLAAYGGLPIDYSTDPVTLHFDDPASIEAARQVLDLAREGYIRYEGLGGAFGARGLAFGFGSDEDVALYNQLFTSFLLDQMSQGDSPYHLAAFPEGSLLSAVSYDLGTAYISATAQSPEACYRFISTVAQHPELFVGMPANRTLLNSPALVNAQGQDAVDYYQGVDQLMSLPNTILIPTAFSGGISAVGEYLTTDWMNRAFDSYVFDGADLDAELADAQIKATAFQECISALPPFEPGAGDPGDYFDQMNTCAVQADPELEGLF